MSTLESHGTTWLAMLEWGMADPLGREVDVRVPRFRHRTLLIAVAAVAVFVGVPLHWMHWLRTVNPTPVRGELDVPFELRRNEYIAPSSMPAYFVGRSIPAVAFFVGRPIPIKISYNLGLSLPKAPTGMFFSCKIETEVKDQATGQVIKRVVYHRHIVSGLHEVSARKLPWSLVHENPGTFVFQCSLSYSDPFGKTHIITGGSKPYQVTVGKSLR